MSKSVSTASFGAARIAVGSVILLAAALCTGDGVCASDSEPEFDAASLKVVPKRPLTFIAGAGPVAMPFQGFRYTPGRVTCVLNLRDLIREAFDIKSWQISGPEFLDGDYQSLEAVMPAKTTRSEARLMLRFLLKARYQLSFHTEQKVLPTYALTIDKSGLKTKPLAGEPPHVSFGSGSGRFYGNAVTLSELASALTGKSDRPVVDETETPGRFDFACAWTPDPEESPGSAKVLDAGLIAALRTQLGLRLEPRRLSQDIVVIDHIEKTPSAN